MTKDEEKNTGQEKSKAELRAARREKQEAQRAAKGVKTVNDKVAKTSGGPEKDAKSKKTQQKLPSSSSESSSAVPVSSIKDKPIVAHVQTAQQENVPARQHTVSTEDPAEPKHKQEHQHEKHSADLPVGAKLTHPIHPAFYQLGLQISSGNLISSDAQAVAMIRSFKTLIKEYHPPADKVFSREIENAMKPCLTFISGGKPLPPSLASLVKQLKFQLSTLGAASEKEIRKNLLEWLDDFEEQKITLSTKAICLIVAEKLRSFKESPVILTFSHSSLVEEILHYAFKKALRFEVIVVDSLPQKQGQILVRSLIKLGVRCRYVLINGLTHVINETDIVLLGADGILANGNVVCTLGGSQVAMVAKVKNIPVLIACQTYKFCEKVQTGTLEAGWPSNEVMPSDFVTGVVTELRTLPCSAVPAVLRVKQLS